MKGMRSIMVLLLGLLLCLGIFACGDIGGGGAGTGNNGDTGGEETSSVDLVITIDSVTADGSNVSVTYTASNLGDTDATAAPFIDFFINRASAPSIGDWGNCYERPPAADFAAGESVSGITVCPSTATAGTSYAIIDTDGLEAEANENNNITSGYAWTSGVVTPNVDLVVTIDSVTADGSSVTFNYTTSNPGDTDATVAPYIDFFINSTSAPAIGDWGDCYVQLLASDLIAGASVSGEKTCASTATSGTAYAIIDTDGLEAEANEDNNITSGLAWTSGGGGATGVDLVVAIDSVTADGSSVTFSYTASNLGDADATVGPWIDLFINSTSAPSIGDWGDCPVQLLAADLTAGASVSGEKACTSGATSGTAYAIIDTDGLETEANENNNITSGYAWTSGGGGSNSAPVANAGPDQTVTTGSLVTLDGSRSSDADGDDLTYSWMLKLKPKGSTTALSSATVFNPNFTADREGAYVLSLVVNDGTVSSEADTVMVRAAPAGMSYIPTGCFDMGDAFGEGNADELPVHNVCITEFYMDVYEVSNVEYKACVYAGECNWPLHTYSYTRNIYWGDLEYDYFPVIFVDWEYATDYCTWAGKRLPTEAEWEYAARGGLSGKRYPWGDTLSGTDANYWNSGDFWDNDTSVRNNYAPNGYGLYDMAGNVWEWVSDWYDSGYYSVSPTNDPQGPANGTGHVLRGGSWALYTDTLRVAFRDVTNQSIDTFSVGFRCARDY